MSGHSKALSRIAQRVKPSRIPVLSGDHLFRNADTLRHPQDHVKVLNELPRIARITRIARVRGIGLQLMKEL